VDKDVLDLVGKQDRIYFAGQPVPLQWPPTPRGDAFMKKIWLLLALLGSAAQAEAVSPETVLAAAKAAAGGAAWDKLQGCHEEGTHGGGTIRYTTRFSLERYGMRVDSEAGGRTRSMGFDGTTPWRSDGEKTIIATDAAALSEAILTDYVSINGFFFPDRFPASFTWLREATEAGRTYDVLAIAPKGSRPLELWFDRATHLIRRVVDSQGTPPTKVEADEYRTIDGLTIATRLTSYGPDGAVADRGVVTSFRCGPLDGTIFEPPKPH
jgi:hypothetical protein